MFVALLCFCEHCDSCVRVADAEPADGVCASVMMNNKPTPRSKFRGGYQLWICLSGLCAKSQCRLQQKNKQTNR
jgi:hypothetical protein